MNFANRHHSFDTNLIITHWPIFTYKCRRFVFRLTDAFAWKKVVFWCPSWSHSTHDRCRAIISSRSNYSHKWHSTALSSSSKESLGSDWRRYLSFLSSLWISRWAEAKDTALKSFRYPTSLSRLHSNAGNWAQPHFGSRPIQPHSYNLRTFSMRPRNENHITKTYPNLLDNCHMFSSYSRSSYIIVT
jgi:hypothetical protein